tara:strand:+ start:3217 stop:4218 length:1002 start_codon:yes stop_codon:yes gene_type:complete
MFQNQLVYSLFIFPMFIFTIFVLSKKLNLVDKPNSRKIHKTNIINVTGIVIYSYLLFIILINKYPIQLENIITVGFIIILIGFADDRIELTPKTKIVLTLFPVSYLILNGFNLTDLGKYEYIGLIKLGKFSIIFTILSVMLLMNAINYTDGTDGLLIGYSITALLYFYFLSNKQSEYLSLFIIFIYILSISLIFNFLPVKSGFKSFLGNAGSLFFGFFFSFILIYLYKFEDIHPAYLIWSCWLSIYDFLFVTLNRIKNKINFSRPDKSHFHHYVLNYFSNDHIKTFIFITFLNFVVICAGYFSSQLIGKIYSLLLFILLFPMFIFIRKKLNKH